MNDDEKQPAKAAETPADSATDSGTSANGWVRTGVAVGIGSAAIVAALLYYNRSTKPPRR